MIFTEVGIRLCDLNAILEVKKIYLRKRMLVAKGNKEDKKAFVFEGMLKGLEDIVSIVKQIGTPDYQLPGPVEGLPTNFEELGALLLKRLELPEYIVLSDLRYDGWKDKLLIQYPEKRKEIRFLQRFAKAKSIVDCNLKIIQGLIQEGGEQQNGLSGC